MEAAAALILSGCVSGSNKSAVSQFLWYPLLPFGLSSFRVHQTLLYIGNRDIRQARREEGSCVDVQISIYTIPMRPTGSYRFRVRRL